MNSDLTISTKSFKQVYSDKSGSLRRDVSRGVNLPTELKIAHQDAIDSATKLPVRRSLVRFDYYVASSEAGKTVPVSFYVVGVIPKDAAVTSSDVTTTAEFLINMLQEDDTGLDLMDEVFVNQEQ